MSDKYDPMKLCKEVDGHYEVDPAAMFPATLSRIKEVLDGATPIELSDPEWKGPAERDPVVRQWILQAENVPQVGWELALKPAGQFERKDGSDSLFNARDAALGFAESYFKRALVLAHQRKISSRIAGLVGRSPGGIVVHISKNVDWKRLEAR